MKTRLICTAIAAVMGFSPLAQARDWQRPGDGDRRGWEQRGDRRGWDNPGDRRGWDNRGDRQPGQGHRHWQDRGYPGVVAVPPQQYPYQPRNPSWPAYGYGDRHGSGYGYGYGGRVQVLPATPYYYGGAAVPQVYAPRYYQGGYLPREYRHSGYVVQDWHSHRLYAPPYGHQWVRVGSDYLLVAIATGLIVSLLMNGY